MALYDVSTIEKKAMPELVAGSRKTNIYRCNSFADYEALPASEKAKYDYVATPEEELLIVSANSSNYSIIGQTAVEITIDFEAVDYSPIGITKLQNNHGSSVLVNGHWWTKDSNNHNILHIYNLSLSASTSFNDLQCLATVTFKHN